MVHIPDDHWVCKLRWGLAGDNEEMISTLAVRGNELGPRDPVEVAHAVFEAWEGAMTSASALGTTYTFLGVDVVAGDGGASGDTASWDDPKPGNAQLNALPSNCAVLVKKRTSKGGRANVGRMFLPGGYINEAAVSPTGEIRAEDLPLLQAAITQFYDNLRDASTPITFPIADFLPVVLHNDPTLEPTPIVSLTVDRLIATQRKRMRR